MELFRPDKPIQSETEDKFQRYAFAKRIAQIVSTGQYPTSLVVGIYGKWGEGKTSVLNCIQKEIPDGTVIINFNPWLFQDERQLIKAYFSSIAAAIGQKLHNRKERAIQLLGDYADSLGTLANLIQPGVGSLFSAGKKISEKLKKDSVEALKQKVDDLIIEANANFTVFIDDIDRLDIQEVQSVFKLVKLVGDFPRTSYILCFDDDMVAAALAPKYAGDNKTAGYAFLEKIIQVPLPLPQASQQALRGYAISLIENSLEQLKIELNIQQRRDFVDKFDGAFVPALTNPRLAVRYSNSIGFSLPLLLGEANIGDLMTIEGIKTFYPELYHFIRNNPSCFISNFSGIGLYFKGMEQKDKEVYRASITRQLEAYPRQKDKLLGMLTDLFPQLRGLFQNYSYSIDFYQKWYREKKICSPQYFDRYFSYVVQDGDISDIYFDNLLKDLENHDEGDLYKRFRIELPKIKVETFLFKLRNYVSALSPQQARQLAILLCRFGAFFSTSSATFGLTDRNMASTVIRELLEVIFLDNRMNCSTQVLKIAEPFEFAIDIHSTLLDPGSYISEKPFVLPSEAGPLAEVVVERFLGEYNNKDILGALPEHLLRYVFNCFFEIGSADQISQYLTQQLSDFSNALRIIKIFTPTVYSSRKPYQYKGDLSRDNYEEMRRFINLTTLYNATISAFGKKEITPNPDRRDSETTDDQLIGIFQKMYVEIERG